MFFYTFMPKLFNMSLTASVAIVLVILLRLLLKKAPKVISYALWGVVLFRLLCPVSIGSDFSVYNLFDAPAQESGTITSVIEYVPSNIVHTKYPSVALPVPGISDAISEALPQGQEQLVADPLEAPMSFATYVWMIGVLGMVIYSIVSYVRLRSKLSVVVPLRDNIFIADDIKSPFVVGLFRPKIYLPCNLGDKEQEYIILHEQHHIKRLDHVMKALAFLALAIHWFNPLVWAAFILASKDMEMSCDEAVIRKVGGDVRADYSASLLTLATGRRIIAGTPLAFGEGDTKGRINNLSKLKKPAVWVVVIAVVACVILASSLLTNPKQDSYTLRIVVPAGSTEEIVYQEDFAYSDEEISPTRNKITISSGEGLGDTEVVLKPIEVTEENAYEPTYLTPGMPVEMDVEKGAWFKVGVNIQNPTDEDIIVYVQVENVEVRISDEITPDQITFQAEILEAHDGYYLVKPEPSWAINSADQIEVPMKNMDPALEPQVGDIIEISYSGEILETYPARLKEVYSIRVVAETTKLTLDDVIILSQYGYDLSWSDFENYDYIETGSGLYIRVYEINEMYELWIGGAGPDSEPMYIYLTLTENSDTRIDIRDGEVTEFIAECNAIAEGIVDLIPMVMVDGKLYLDTGLSSNADARCGVMDGEITSTVDGSQRPTENNQSNFGTGYGYQFGATEGTIEIYMNEEWWIFATEKVRDTLHFPTTERAFEFDFAGNTSGGQKMELTEIYPYWCIRIENTGDGTIQMEIQGEVYRVEAGTTKIFCSDEKWEAGTYTVSFSSAGHQPMQGSAICTRSKVPMTDKVGVEYHSSEIPGGTRFIIEIRDRAEEEQLFCAEAEELFYEDDTTKYYFNVIKSHYIMVVYNNGNSEDIVTALNAGRATIADLDAFGVEYYTESKM